MLADIIAGTIFLVSLWFGWKKGFIRTVLDFAYIAIALFLSATFYPVASAWMIQTDVAKRVEQAIQLHLEQRGTEVLDTVLPDFLRGATGTSVSAGAAGITAQLMSVLAFVVLFVVLCIALRLVSVLLNSIAKLPLLRTVNKLGGLAIGGMNGLILLYLLLAVVAVLEVAQGKSWLEGSVFAAYLYRNNFILKNLF